MYPSKKLLVVLAAAAGLIAACTPSIDTSPSTTSSTVLATTTRPTVGDTTTTSIDPNAALEDQCGDIDGPFSASGTVGTGGNEDSDARVIEAYSWDQVGACERVRIGFATAEGAPAVAPPSMGVSFLRWAGVIRIDLGAGVTDAVVAEQLVDTELVDRIYTVTQVDGTVFVDIHLSAPAFARAFTTSGPAAVAIDLASGGRPYADPSVRVGDLVVIPPDPEVATYPLTISGYSVGAGDSIEGLLQAPDGSTVAGEAAVGPNAFTWGAFSMVFPDGPGGDVLITVDTAVQLELTLP